MARHYLAESTNGYEFWQFPDIIILQRPISSHDQIGGPMGLIAYKSNPIPNHNETIYRCSLYLGG